MPSNYVMKPKRTELEIAKTKLEASIHQKVRNENSMSDWAISGTMRRDLDAVTYWQRRIAELTEDVHRCETCGEMECESCA